jgi:RNA polymerase sigma factor (sigma-70 family)
MPTKPAHFARKSKYDSSDRRNLLIEKHLGLVFAIAVRFKSRLGPQVDLGDLIGDGSIGLLNAANRYRPRAGCPFSRLAGRCIRAAIVDGLRSWAHSRRAGAVAMLSPGSIPVDGAGRIDARAEHVDHLDQIEFLLSCLPYRRRRVLRMHFLKEMRLKQIAARLRISEARVSQLIRKALEQCRRAA